MSIDLFSDLLISDPIKPVRPRALKREEWPPDYSGVLAWRIRQLEKMRSDPSLVVGAKAYYSTRPSEFIMHWMDTFDPRREDTKWIPFIFFERQLDLVDFLHECFTEGQSGLIEKCRDAGATWVSCAYSVWRWLFVENDALGWGSRKESLVDKLGDADSIFEKMRLLINRLPAVFRPAGFNPRNHTTYMKLMNPENGAIIAGEAGDNIGRGGRKSGYFKDEAQPLDEPVLTPTGWRLMGDLCVGDEVIGADGRPTKITHINDCGEHLVYEVVMNDGGSTRASQNHLWTVTVKGQRKNVTTQWLFENHIYTAPCGQIQYPVKIQCSEHWKNRTARLPLEPYVVGVLLGDGSVGGVPNDTPSFTSIDQDIVDNVEKRLPEGVILSTSGDLTYRLVDERGGMGNKPDKKSRARQSVLRAGIAGKRSYEKSIPLEYKNANSHQRLEILQGLMDTDGSAANGGYPTFHTSSPMLAKDVMDLVFSLGGVASCSTKKDKRGFRDQIIVYARLPSEFSPFKMERKVRAIAQRKQKIERSIKEVEPVGILPVRCITVEAEDGLYVTKDWIVTHNSAWYERPEKIEAALGDNTNVQIDISSVNGLGNVFHRRREQGVDWFRGADLPRGKTRVFVIDWSDHPAKTQEWYDERREKFEREGMLHIFAQEVERNYSASVSNTIILQEWILASVDAHLKVPCLIEQGVIDRWGAGFDVADEGIDRNAFALRQGNIIRHVEEWGERDAGVSTRRAVAACRGRTPLKVQYDSVGLGSAVKAEYNRLVEDGLVNSSEIQFVPWNAGAKVMWPFERVIEDDDQSPTNKAMFFNLKAQAWWSLRSRFYKTYRAIKDGIVYRPDELISIDSRMELLHQLTKELSQATKGDSSTLQMLVNKKPNGTKSPNLADAVVQCMFPVDDSAGQMVVGRY